MRRFVLLFAFVVLLSGAAASIELLEPVNATISSEEHLDLGKLMPGETLEIIVDAHSELSDNAKWTEIELLSDLEAGMQLSSRQISSRSLVLGILVPNDIQLGEYTLQIQVSNPGEGISENFYATFSVEENLLQISISDLKQQTTVDTSIEYELLIQNDSIAEHTVIVDSDLGIAWFKPKSYEIKPGETLTRTITLTPRVYGKKNFKFRVTSQLNNSLLKEFDAELFVHPTIKGKLTAPNYGLPFFAFNSIPYYLFNSFLGFLLPG